MTVPPAQAPSAHMRGHAPDSRYAAPSMLPSAGNANAVDEMLAQLAALGTAGAAGLDGYTSERTRTTTVKYSARDATGRPAMEHTTADMNIVRDAFGNIVEATVERSTTDKRAHPHTAPSSQPAPSRPGHVCRFPGQCTIHDMSSSDSSDAMPYDRQARPIRERPFMSDRAVRG